VNYTEAITASDCRDSTTYSLFTLLSCMWNNDRSFKVSRQYTAAVTKCEDCWTILQWSLAREETFTNSVKVTFYISGQPLLQSMWKLLSLKHSVRAS